MYLSVTCRPDPTSLAVCIVHGHIMDTAVQSYILLQPATAFRSFGRAPEVILLLQPATAFRSFGRAPEVILLTVRVHVLGSRDVHQLPLLAGDAGSGLLPLCVSFPEYHVTPGTCRSSNVDTLTSSCCWCRSVGFAVTVV
eukprot:jgi/Ulvmu1/3831/UM018_0043.1